MEEYSSNSIIINPVFINRHDYLSKHIYIGKKTVDIELSSDVMTNDGDFISKISGSKRMVKRDYRFTVVSDSALIKMAKRSVYASLIVAFISYSHKFKNSTGRKCNDGTLYITEDDMIKAVSCLYENKHFLETSRKNKLDIINECLEQLIEDKIVYRIRDISNKGQMVYLDNMYVIDPFEYSNGENVYDIYMYMQSQYEVYKKSKYFISNDNIECGFGSSDENNNKESKISSLDFKGYMTPDILNVDISPQSAILRIFLVMYHNGKRSFKMNYAKIVRLSSKLFGIGISKNMVRFYISELIKDCIVEIDPSDEKRKHVRFTSLYKPNSVCNDVISYLINKGIDVSCID